MLVTSSRSGIQPGIGHPWATTRTPHLCVSSPENAAANKISGHGKQRRSDLCRTICPLCLRSASALYSLCVRIMPCVSSALSASARLNARHCAAMRLRARAHREQTDGSQMPWDNTRRQGGQGGDNPTIPTSGRQGGHRRKGPQRAPCGRAAEQ